MTHGRPIWWLSRALVMLAGGCAMVDGEQGVYLRSARDRATQAEVRQHLGVPRLTDVESRGQSVWVYEVREQQPGNRMTAPGMWCDEYVLRFDDTSILRDWKHKSYFHGGENMPEYCVPGGYRSKS